MRRLVSGVAVSAVLLTSGLLSGCEATDLPLPGSPVDEDESISLRVEFDDVLNLVPRSPVKVNDVTVGEVVELKRVGWHAEALLRIQDDVDLPASTARAVYRIVQEALTNAVKHAPGGGIRVQVERVGPDVRLEVVNDCDRPPDPVPGHGLVNMRERARLEGGELEAGPIDGGFRVRATLPVSTAVPS